MTQTAKSASIKEKAHDLIDHLADDADWDDVMYAIYVRQKIDAGIADGEAYDADRLDRRRAC
jgi:hypothetical protein